MLNDPILPKDVDAGQAVYSRRVLSLYDVLVLGLSNRFIWKCPTSRLVQLYNDHVSANHLDVGVGTGFFLDKCRFPSTSPRLVLMDLNENCLAATAQRVARYSPQTVRRNVLESVDIDGAKFDSIGLNYVLHCLPGRLADKCVVFDHLRPLLNDGGVVFGSTLLSQGIHRGFAARRLMAAYNGKGIFSNSEDSLDELQRQLAARFGDWSVEVAGCAAIFSARK
ncbi:class I SAM-dependent methyltransferase [Planctomicrobium piriforme]|uniref:Methyltransferase domain-containing protein n=1 Tax=Planctomicrobium piriforme TaxID=1576369 RepID=A0A1I3FGQ9_9PLAN|nr:class I SAM-dependent methyltransferase [Planctomicrobium piriforme]SFI10395.1 Methyltransferase domain-containing protein [Planctomicrobium piriforme]